VPKYINNLWMHQLKINHLKGHVIKNDVHVFDRKCPSWLRFIANIKIIGLKDQILILLQLGDGDISYSHTSSHLRSLLMHLQTFYTEVKNFTKNGDKFGWVKYWQMTFNSPNSPKFSPTTILCYTVFDSFACILCVLKFQYYMYIKRVIKFVLTKTQGQD